MPIFYNQGSPTPTTKNTINSVSVNYGIRDFLLNLNLAPQYPQIPTTINGSPKIGEPVLDTMAGTGNIVIPIGLPLVVNGLLFKDLNVIYNTFQNDSSQSNNIESINYIPDILNTNYLNSEWPVGSSTSYPTGPNTQIDKYGILAKTTEANYKKRNVIKNLYLDEAKQIDISDFIDLQPLDISQQIPSYLDVFGGLNQGGTAGEQAENIIGGIISGQGIGIGTNGSLVPNFDIRSSLAGRVLGATGLLKDTKLGTIGGQQLALALANNAAFNTQQELLGALNVKENLYSLIKDGNLADFPRPSYKITIPRTSGGRILDTAGKILGFTLPRSYLDDAGSLFQTESGVIDNIDRANEMILNTGKGQVASLISNIRANLDGIGKGGTTVDNPDNSKFRSGYAPAYNNNKGTVQITDGILYAFSKQGKIINLFGSDDGIIANIAYNRDQMVSDAGFMSPDELGVGIGGAYIPSGYNNRKVSDISFSWTSDNGDSVNKFPNISAFFPGATPVETQIHNDKKSLLTKTQILFNSKGMKNLVSVKGEMGVNSSQIQTANNNGLSKGSGVLSASRFDLENGLVNSSGSEAINNFCRSWTTTDRYDSVNNLIRHKGLYDKNKVPYRFQTKNSVLEEGGFVKIAPYIDDKPEDPKKFMFSIENLAWAGDPWTNLPQSEQGPGDLITGKKGRVMWFPPYDIQFSENNNIDWESNKFIGRGEPVYTYNNTERGGTLSFKIIVDHPSYFNAFRGKSGQNGPDDNYIASFFAGCIDPTENMIKRLINVTTSSQIITNDIPIIEPKVDLPKPPPAILKVYFPNDNAKIPTAYESGLSGASISDTIDYSVNCDGFQYGVGAYPSDITQKDVNGVTRTWNDRYNFGLNYKNNKGEQYSINGKQYYGYNDPNYTTAMIDFLKNECKYCVVKAKGYASPQGNSESNIKLANRRGEYIINELKTKWGSALGLKTEDLNKRFKVEKGKALTNTGCPIQTAQYPDPPTDIIDCKLDRYVEITVEYSSELATEGEKALQSTPKVKKETRTIVKEITDKMYSESKYFERMVEDNPFVFDEIRQKIRYFHPAFHSTTPEGLNSRLNFLLQCTRQGPTLESKGATNLAFGRPPVCILRIGDFYNTKIIMENVNIDYEPLVWDLNPEGIGVQPMIANVDISFKFIGGSSLYGPISKLQNALSFNYFANTQVYDPRADYISKIKSFATPDSIETRPEDNSITDKLKEDNLKNLGSYRIVNGVDKYDPEEGKIISDILTVENSEVDQVKADEMVNSGVENTVQPDLAQTNFNDSEVIECIRIKSYQEVYDNDDTLSINLLFTPPEDKPNMKLVLQNTTKTYKGVITLRRQESNSVDTICNFTLRYNDANSVIFEGSSEIVASSSINIWLISMDIDEATLKILLDAKNDFGKEKYSLKLNWSTGGSGSSIGFY